MIFGTQYYRPPFPNDADWVRDLDHIKEMGFNTVKLWAVWNWIEAEKGIYTFDELDKLVELCEQRNLQVIINTIPEGAPSFSRKEHQDALYCLADGTALDYSGPANIPSAGWPGLCPDSEMANELICNFVYETARHFADSNTVIGIDVWNEPHLEPSLEYSGQLMCYCEHSVAKFKDWLKEKYANITKLNETWFRKYHSFDEIIPPKRFGTGTDMIDWKKFWLENLATWMRSRVQAARKGAPNKMIQSHSAFSGYMGANNEGGLGNELGDEFLLANEVDVYGVSSFPLWLMGDEHLVGHFINVEIIAEACREKMFYQTELQGGAGKAGLLGGKVPTYSDVRLWNWNILAGGGKGVLYWQYAAEPAGLEAPGFGLVDETNKDTRRAISASDFAKEYNTEELDNAKRVLSTNGILLSRNSDLFTYAAMEEKQYAHSFKGVYQALYDNGVPVRFVHEDYIADIIKEGIENLYIPMGLSLSKDVCAKLSEFVVQGGNLILEGPTAMYDETGASDMKFAFLREMVGGSIVSIDLQDGIGYRTLIDDCAEDIIKERFVDGYPSLASRQVGKGKVIWLSAFLGKKYWKERDKELGKKLIGFFAPTGYAQFTKLTANGLVVRLLENESQFLIVVINHYDEEKELEIIIAGKQIKETIPALDGRLISITK